MCSGRGASSAESTRLGGFNLGLRPWLKADKGGCHARVPQDALGCLGIGVLASRRARLNPCHCFIGLFSGEVGSWGQGRQCSNATVAQLAHAQCWDRIGSFDELRLREDDCDVVQERM